MSNLFIGIWSVQSVRYLSLIAAVYLWFMLSPFATAADVLNLSNASTWDRRNLYVIRIADSIVLKESGLIAFTYRTIYRSDRDELPHTESIVRDDLYSRFPSPSATIDLIGTQWLLSESKDDEDEHQLEYIPDEKLADLLEQINDIEAIRSRRHSDVALTSALSDEHNLARMYVLRWLSVDDADASPKVKDALNKFVEDSSISPVYRIKAFRILMKNDPDRVGPTEMRQWLNNVIYEKVARPPISCGVVVDSIFEHAKSTDDTTTFLCEAMLKGELHPSYVSAIVLSITSRSLMLNVSDETLTTKIPRAVAFAAKSDEVESAWTASVCALRLAEYLVDKGLMTDEIKNLLVAGVADAEAAHGQTNHNGAVIGYSLRKILETLDAMSIAVHD
jgi:hypothetical protein